MPQRRPFRTGTHLRENRKGRTGADSAYVLHAGTAGFGFGDGEVWAVHTAWSGNHIHYAERVFTGEQLIGGGELLLPGEMRLAPGESYESPWLYGAYGDGLDEVAAALPPAPAARPRTGLGRPPGDAQRLGGGLLRPRPGPAGRPRGARRRARRRAVRAR